MEQQLDVTLDRDERRALKRRRKALGALLLASAYTETLAELQANTDPQFQEPGAHERTLRKLLAAGTDLRLLGIESFRESWQHVLAACERHRLALVAELEKSSEDLAAEPALGETESGRRALRLLALAGRLLDELAERWDALAVPTDSLPVFGSDEDAAARRARKRFKGLGVEYGDLLAALARTSRLVRERYADARDEVHGGSCPLTAADTPAIGGGWVRVSVDGGPETVLAGQTDVALLPGLTEYWFGADNEYVQGVPYIVFAVEGEEFARPGVHSVTGFPERDPDGHLRDFAAGYYENRPVGVPTSRLAFVSGTVTIDEARVTGPRRRRLIEGSFDVIGMVSGGTQQRRFTGSFHLCRFKYEGEDGYE